jgi:translation initiation factor 1
MSRAGRSALGGLVYSTETGRSCPQCSQAQAACVCKQLAAAAQIGDGQVRVTRETKGRAGKGVTLVRGLPLTSDALAELAKALKQRCGSGGSVVDGVIEIQGEHRDSVLAELLKRGFAAKRAGG